ncbi:MAG: hypothetical protein ACRDNW_00370 [Trebonia sp.]
MGALVLDREEGDPDTAGIEADAVAEGASHPRGLQVAASAGQHADEEPGVEGGSIYRVTDVDTTCAALLHDAVEGHAGGIAPGGGREDTLAVLARQFGERTAGLVGAVTNPPWAPGRDKHKQYREHVARSLDASPWARVVKVSDPPTPTATSPRSFSPKASTRSSRPGRQAARGVLTRHDRWGLCIAMA